MARQVHQPLDMTGNLIHNLGVPGRDGDAVPRSFLQDPANLRGLPAPVLPLLPEPWSPGIVRRNGADYEIYRRQGRTPIYEWILMRRDPRALGPSPTDGTGMHNPKAWEVWTHLPLIPITSANSTFTQSPGRVLSSAYPSLSGYNLTAGASAGGAITTTVTLEEGDDLYAVILARADGGFARIDLVGPGGNAVTPLLPLNSGVRVINCYKAGASAVQQVLIAKGVSAGVYTVTLTRESATPPGSSGTVISLIAYGSLSQTSRLPGSDRFAHFTNEPWHVVTENSGVFTSRDTLTKTPTAFSMSGTETRIYVTASTDAEFDRLQLVMSSPSATALGLTVEFSSSSSAWTPVSGLVDGTTGLSANGVLSWTAPAGWVRQTVNGRSAKWLRITASAPITLTMTRMLATMGGTATRVLIMVAPGSEWDRAKMLVPEGGTLQELGGELHRGEVNHTKQIFADGVNIAELPDGTAVPFNVLEFRQVQAITQASGESEVIHRFVRGHLESPWEERPSKRWTISSYAYSAMLPALIVSGVTGDWVFRRVTMLDGARETYDLTVGPPNASFIERQSAGLVYWDPSHNFALLVAQPRYWQDNRGYTAAPKGLWLSADPGLTGFYLATEATLLSGVGLPRIEFTGLVLGPGRDLYVGREAVFNSVQFQLDTLAGTNDDFVVEYFSSSGWAPVIGAAAVGGGTLTVADDTRGMNVALASLKVQKAGAGSTPLDWQRTTVQGKNAFWYRLRRASSATVAGRVRPTSSALGKVYSELLGSGQVLVVDAGEALRGGAFMALIARPGPNLLIG